MENPRYRRLCASLTMVGLLFSQLATGVFPIPIAPVETAQAAGFGITLTRDDADASEPVAQGDTIRYRVVVQNNDSQVANVRIVNPIPSELEYASSSDCRFIAASPGREDEVICPGTFTNGSLDHRQVNPGNTYAVEYTLRVTANTDTCFEIANQADVWNEDANAIPPEWSNVVRIPTVGCLEPELEVTKTANKSEVEPGDTLQYTINVENKGDADAENVVVTDQLPDGLSFSSGSGCSEQGNNTISCNLGDIREGRSDDVRVTVLVDSTIQPGDYRCGNNSAFVNQAKANADNANEDVSPSVHTRLNCPAPDLSITKTPSKTSVTGGIGEKITYTIDVENTGGAAANNLLVTDTPPTGLTFLDRDDGGSSDSRCNFVNGQVECESFALGDGRSARYNLQFEVESNVPCGIGALRNTAELRQNNAGGPVLETSNETRTDVDCGADLEMISKTVIGSSVAQPGETLTFRITIKNNGPSPVPDAVVKDGIPNGLEYNPNAHGNTCPKVGNDVLCDPIYLCVGQTETYTLVFDVPASASATCPFDGRNTGWVFSDTVNDPGPKGNDRGADFSVECAPVADLSVTKASSKTTTTAGEQITFTVTVANTGTADATDIFINDYIPNGLEFDDTRSHRDCFEYGNRVVCSDEHGNIQDGFTVRAGATERFDLVFTVLPTAPCGNDTIRNTAEVRETSANGHIADTSNEVTVDVDCGADLEMVSKTVVGSSVAQPGGTLAFEITIKNNGPAVVPDAVLKDGIPSGLSYNPNAHGNPCPKVGNDVLCNPVSLAVGESLSYLLTFDVPASASATCPFDGRNTGWVFSNTVNDPGPKGNDRGADFSVECAPSGNLSASKTPQYTNRDIGQQIRYRISLVNSGGAPVTGINITDNVPAGLHYKRAKNPSECTFNDVNGSTTVVTCNNLTVGANTTKNIDLFFQVTEDAPCGGSITNTANIRASGQPNLNPSGTIYISDCPQLDITKTARADEVDAGQNITYDIRVENVGSQATTSVRVFDFFIDNNTFQKLNPQPFTFVSSNGATCQFASVENYVYCDIGSLSAGAVRSFSITFSTPNNAQFCDQLVMNQADAHITGQGTAASDWDKAMVTVRCANAEMEAFKIPRYPSVGIGEDIKFSVRIVNDGNAPLTGVQIVDQVPNGLTFDPNHPNLDDRCTESNGTITCSSFTVPANDDLYVELFFDVNEDTALCGTSITNRATVTAPGQSTLYPEGTININDCADLDITKTPQSSTVTIGSNITYDIVVKNEGNAYANNVRVFDFYIDNNTFQKLSPQPFTFVSASNGVSCWFETGQNHVACNLGNMAAGATKPFTLTFAVPNDPSICNQQFMNQADAHINNGQGTAASDWDKKSITVLCQPAELEAFKIPRFPSKPIGEDIKFSIRLVNDGDLPLTGVQIVDQVPEGLDFDPTHPNLDNRCTESNRVVTCSSFTVPAKDDLYVELFFIVNEDAVCGSSITNRATVTAPGQPTLYPEGTLQIEDCPDLAITKSVQDEVIAGENVTYTVTVTNNGTATPLNTRVLDYFIDNHTLNQLSSAPFTFVSANGATCSTTSSTAHLECYLDNGQIPPGQTETFTMTWSTPAGQFCDQQIMNQVDAHITGGAFPHASDWAKAMTTVRCPDPDIRILKTVDAYTLPGSAGNQRLSYEVEVQNLGGVPLTNIRVTDAIPFPNEMLFVTHPVSDILCNRVGNNIVCDPFDLAVNEPTKTLKIEFSVNTDALCGQTITNRAQVQTNETGSAYTNAVNTTVGACATPDLNITKSADVQSLQKGSNDEIEYTITVQNSGNGAATNLYVSDAVPTGLTYINNVNDGCVPSGNNIVCGAFDVQPNSSTSFRPKFRINDYAPCGPQGIRNVAQLRENSSYGLVIDTSNEVITEVVCNAELNITKSGSPYSVTKGSNDQLTYTISVHNSGNGVSENLYVTDQIPTGLDYVLGSDPNCSMANASELRCGVFTVGVNQSVTFTPKFTLNDYAQCGTGTLRNIARLRTTGFTGPIIDTSDEVRTDVICNAQLNITKSADVDSLTKGSSDEIEYTITVQNSGNGAATNLYVSDAVPTGLTYINNVNDGCVPSGNNIVCGAFDVQPNSSTSFRPKFSINDYAPCGTDTIPNVAQLRQNSPYGTIIGTSNTVRTDVLCNAEMAAFKIPRFPNKAIGEDIKFSVRVVNDGNAPLTGVEIVDQLPAGLTFDPNHPNLDDRCTESNGTITCSSFTVPANDDLYVELFFEVNEDTNLCGTSITNRATVTAPGQSTLYPEGTLNIDTCPILDITKTPETAEVIAGQNITYEIEVRNTGNGTAYNVKALDFFIDNATFQKLDPPPFTFASSNGVHCTVADGVVDCGLGDIQPNGVYRFWLTFRTPAEQFCDQSIMNQADAHINGGQATFASDWDKKSVTVRCPDAVLTGTKTAEGNKTFQHGDVFTYTIRVDNTSQTTVAQNVNVFDPTPSHLEYVDSQSDGSCEPRGTQGADCGPFTIQPGGYIEFDIAYRVLDSAPCGNNTIPNIADLTADNAPDGWTNEERINIDCPPAEISGTKTADVSSVEHEDLVTFTIEVTNDSQTVTAKGINIVDPRNEHLMYLDGSSDILCEDDDGDGTVECGTFDLAPQTSRSVEIVYKVLDTAPCGQNTIVNLADLSADNAPDAWTNQEYVDVFCPNPEFRAEKSVDQTNASPGDIIVYTIELENTGNQDLTGTWLFDTIPTGLDFLRNDEDSRTDARCFESGNAVRCGEDPIPSTDPNSTDTYTLAFTVLSDPTICDTNVENTADVLFTGNNNLGGTTNTVATKITCPEAQLDITKSGPNKVIAGGQVTYDFIVSNTGDGTATDVLIEDFFKDDQGAKITPAPFTFVSSNGATCTSNGTDVTCGLGDIEPGAANRVEFSMTFTTPEDTFCNQSIINNADAHEQPLGQNTSDWDDHTVGVECLEPELDIVKSGPGEIDAGDDVTYTFTVTNNGDGEAVSVEVEDFFIDGNGDIIAPAPFTFSAVSGATCSGPLNGIMSCDLGDIASNSSATFTLTFSTPAAQFCDQDITNRAAVDEQPITIATAADTNDHTLTVRCPIAEIDTTKAATVAGPVTPGDTFNYTIAVTNNGAADATDLRLTDNLPQGLSYDDTNSTGICEDDDADGTVNCTPFSVAAGATESFTIAVIVNEPVHATSPLACNQSLVNVGQVFDSGDVLQDTTNTVTLPVDCPAPILSAVKSSSETIVAPQDRFFFTIAVTNNGTADAINTVIDDPIPANLSFVAHDPAISATSDVRCTENTTDNTIECALGNLSSTAGSNSTSVDLYFDVDLNIDCTETISNLADIFADNAPTVWTNAVSVDVDCDTSFTATKTADQSTVSPGDRLTYEIRVENTGNTSLHDLWLLDNTPAGLAFVEHVSNDPTTSDSRCYLHDNSPLVKCGNDTIEPGNSDTYTLVFDVLPDAPCDGTITNVADVVFVGNGNLSGQTNNEDVDVSCPDATLKVSKSADRTKADIGDLITYYISVENTSQTVDALKTSVFDDVISEFTYRDDLSSGLCDLETGNIVECGEFTLDAGDTMNFQIVFEVNSSATCDSTIYNQAEANAENADPALSESVSVDIECAPEEANLVVTKVTKDGSQQIMRGETIVYKVTVDNAGPDTARNIDLTDFIPEVQVQDQSTFVPLTFNPNMSDATCRQQGDAIECDPFTLAPTDTPRVFFIAFDVPPNAHCARTILNEAFAESDTYDPNTYNNSDTHIATVTCATGTLDITKSGPDTAKHGDIITYNITVTNNLGFTVTRNRVIDPIPAYLQYVSADSNLCREENYANGPEVICGEFDLAPGQSESFALNFRVSDLAPCEYSYAITNIADVWSEQDGIDPQWSNPVQTFVLCDAKLEISKTDYRNTAKIGDILDYEITVRNTSSVDARNVEVTDILPYEVEFISASDNGQYLPPNLHMVKWTIDLNPGEIRTLNVQARVKSKPPHNEPLLNEVCTDQYVCAEDLTAIQEDAIDFVVTKTDNREEAAPGETLNYIIDILNVSTTDATGIRIVDNGPHNAQFESAVLPTEVIDLQEVGNQLIMTANIPAGQTIRIELEYTVDDTARDGEYVVNDVCVVHHYTELACDEDHTRIVNEPLFSIVKTDNRTTVQPGEQLTYEILVRNNGTTSQQDVEIVDELPSLVDFDQASHSGTFTNGEVRWTLASIAAGQEVRLTVDVTVDPTANDGDVLYNFVEIIGGPNDDDSTRVVEDVVEVGCIDIVKETFNQQGQPLTPVTQFTFALNGTTQTVQNDSTGRARFNNVPVGQNTVTETIPDGWRQDSVTPAAGVVTVFAGSNCSTVTFKNSQLPVGTAKFTISKTDNKATAEPGDRLTYQIEVKNISDIDAENVEITDPIPDDTTFISASDGGSRNGQTITWTLDIAAGETKKLTMRVDVDSNADNGDVISNTATITDGPSATDTTTVEDRDDDDDDDNDDDDDDDNDDDIRVSINDDPDPIDICHDDDLEYEIRLTNSRNSNERVDVIALLDGDTDYQSSSDGGKEKSGDRVEWDNVRVSRNSSKTLRLRVRAKSGSRDGDTYRLRVAVSDGDEDTEVTRVRNGGCGEDDDDDGIPVSEPALSIDKTADGNTTEALAGSVVSYTITIRNTSNSDIPAAELIDDYPEQLVSISDPGGATDAGGQLRWNLGTLRANSTTVVRYRVRVLSNVSNGAYIRNTATVRAGPLTRSDDHTIVVPVPPQTGLGGFIKSLAKRNDNITKAVVGSQVSKAVAVRPQARTAPSIDVSKAASAASLPVIVWMTTMLTGLGVGGLFGRRFLI